MNLADLRTALYQLDDASLRSIARRLGLDYDALAGDGTVGRTRSLVERARDRRKLDALEAALAAHLAVHAAPALVDAGVGAPSGAQDVSPGLQDQAALPAAQPIALVPPVTSEPEPTVVETPPEPGQPVPVRVREAQRVRTGESRPWPLWAFGLIGLLLAAGVALALLRALGGPSAAPATVTPSPVPVLARASATATVRPVVPTAGVQVLGTLVVPTLVPLQPATPPPGTASIVLVTTPTALPTPVPASTNTPAPSATPGPTATAAATNTPTPESLPRLRGEAGSPVEFVNVLNQQVRDYLLGSIGPAELKTNWQGTALEGVQKFLDSTVPSALALAPRDARPVDTRMRYLGEPIVATDALGNASVTVREWWRYTARRNDKTACETRDYFYKLVKVPGGYKVDEFKGTFVDASCAER